MRALLDTNIIIHRENKKITNYSIGHLFRWLDKLKYEKVIHPYSVEEIQKYRDPDTKYVITVKLESYNVLKTIVKPTSEVLSIIGKYDKSDNDRIDNYLIYEVYLGRVDLLITEDRRLRNKANELGIGKKVFSINQFITNVSSQNPELIDYKMLAVKKEYFGNINIQDSFFDNFKSDYKEFVSWFNKKCDNEAYVCRDDDKRILGFLYLKPEDENENYSSIIPALSPRKRLKVGTFKVESTGFRLGERFIKIIFDNAIRYNVDEIYVTLFQEREELMALSLLLQRWGFKQHGIKKTNNGDEIVLIKELKRYNKEKTVKENFPNIYYNGQKFILPILPKYHTPLLPDSKINTEYEINFLGNEPHKYALQKVYISFSSERNIHAGDLIVFYRPGTTQGRKKYESVLTTIGIVDEINYNFSNKEEYKRCCQNRTVFTEEELDSFWLRKQKEILVVKFIFVKSMTKRLTLEYLWEKDIVLAPNGPRPFTKITDSQFNEIIKDSQTELFSII